MEYDFSTEMPVPVGRFIRFFPTVNSVDGIPKGTVYHPFGKNVLKEDERLAYKLSRHFKSVGPKEKLSISNSSSLILTTVAAHFNNTKRFEEAKMYSQAAVRSAMRNHVVAALASTQLFFALSNLQSNQLDGPDSNCLSIYREALVVSEWHLGAENPISIITHDKLSLIYHKAKMMTKGLAFHKNSLDIALKSLGQTHTITAGYYTRAGCYHYTLGDIEVAISYLARAAEIYTSLSANPALVAEVHYYFADCMYERGDFDGAIHHSQACRVIRERIYGLSDSRVTESCRQCAKMILAPFKNHNGVLTPQMKQAYKDAIQCNEKVFRYLQGVKTNARKGLRGKTNKEIRVVPSLQICGPIVNQPFGWHTPLSVTMLHKIMREIISMKLTILESQRHRECIRTLRAASSAGSAFDAKDAKDAIVRMAAVSPSIYLDDIFQRIDHEDQIAMKELKLVLTLTENETLGIAA
jgi:tetratricopeptide (TPR) repeat protein